MSDPLSLRLSATDPAASDASESPRARPDTQRSAAVEPLLVSTDQAAAACGVSAASWYRLKAAGKTPAPVRLGGKVLYRISDLELWVSLGCPGRKDFEARLAARNGRK